MGNPNFKPTRGQRAGLLTLSSFGHYTCGEQQEVEASPSSFSRVKGSSCTQKACESRKGEEEQWDSKTNELASRRHHRVLRWKPFGLEALHLVPKEW